jgi:hypothetical protein
LDVLGSSISTIPRKMQPQKILVNIIINCIPRYLTSQNHDERAQMHDN